MLAIDTLAEIKHKIQMLVVVRNGKPIEILHPINLGLK